MGIKNCPNCGMPIDYEYNKCKYCGTMYYDLSCMPMNKPFFLRVNIDSYSKQEILAKVRLNTTSIIMEIDALPQIELNLVAESLNIQKGELQ